MTDDNLQGEIPAEGAELLPAETPDTSDSPAELVEATESPADDAGQRKPRGVGARIDELTRNWREAERREQALLAMLQQNRTPTPEPTPAPAPTTPPTLEQFGYDDAKYQAAFLDYTRAEVRREAESLLIEREREAAARRVAESFQKRAQEFAATKPDYREKVLDPTLPITPVMAELIQHSDDGPALAYYLASNRDVTENIARLPELAAARELGRIEAKLSQERTAARAAPKPQVSQAPPPPPKLDAADPEIDKDPDQMSVNEWLRWRNKQINRKRK